MALQRTRAIRTVRRLGVRLRRWLCGCEAVSATEYAIMLALIVLVAAGTIRMIGEDFFNLYTSIANAVGDTI